MLYNVRNIASATATETDYGFTVTPHNPSLAHTQRLKGA